MFILPTAIDYFWSSNISDSMEHHLNFRMSYPSKMDQNISISLKSAEFKSIK